MPLFFPISLKNNAYPCHSVVTRVRAIVMRLRSQLTGGTKNGVKVMIATWRIE